MPEPVRYAIFVYDEVEPIDIGGTFGVLSMARRVAPHIEMFLIAENAGPVRLTNNLIVEAQFGIDSFPKAEFLIVTGGAGWKAQCENSNVLNFIRTCALSMTVASVCTGGMILAAAGILDGLSATTKQEVFGSEQSPLRVMADTYANITAVPARYIDTGRVITGGGVSLAIDVTLHLIEKACGKLIAEETARIIEYSAAANANEQRLKSVIF